MSGDLKDSIRGNGGDVAGAGSPELSLSLAQSNFDEIVSGPDTPGVLEVPLPNGKTEKIGSRAIKGFEPAEEPSHVYVQFQHFSREKMLVIGGGTLISVAALAGIAAVINKRKHGHKP